MTTNVRTFLMFQDNNAEEAMRFYLAVFPEAKLVELVHNKAGQPGKEGAVLRGVMSIGQQTLQCFDSPVKHNFNFTPATSLFVECDTVDEVDRIWSRLSDRSSVLMELGTYEFSRRFGWLNDRFGVSWQVTVA